MGYVEELSSGRWRGIPWNAKAKRRDKSESFDTWEEADAYWRRVEAELEGTYAAAGLTVDRQRRGVPLWADHVIAWASKGAPDAEKSTRGGDA